MPYKNKEAQRECERRWYQRNRLKKCARMREREEGSWSKVASPEQKIMTISYIYGVGVMDLAKHFKISHPAVCQNVAIGLRRRPQLQKIGRVIKRDTINLIPIGNSNDLEKLEGRIATNGGRRNNRLKSFITGR